MKNGIVAALLVVMAGIAHAGNAGTTTIDRQMEIDAAMAPIRTPAQLAHHISSVRDSPLDNLPPRARREFLDGLTFTPEGLGGFSHLPLASLGVDDAYRIRECRPHYGYNCSKACDG